MPQCRIFFSFDCIILEFPLQDSAACLFVFWALNALNLILRMILAGLRNKNIKDLAGEIQAFCISSPCQVIAFSYWEILRKMYCQKAKCCFSDRNPIQTSCNIFLTTRCIDGSSWNFSSPTRNRFFLWTVVRALIYISRLQYWFWVCPMGQHPRLGQVFLAEYAFSCHVWALIELALKCDTWIH